MRTAGVEGFTSSPSGFYLEDIREDEAIRNKDDNTWYSNIFSPYNENLYLIYIGACAGELHQRQKITEVVVDDIPITESQSQDASSMDHGIKKTPSNMNQA